MLNKLCWALMAVSGAARLEGRSPFNNIADNPTGVANLSDSDKVDDVGLSACQQALKKNQTALLETFYPPSGRGGVYQYGDITHTYTHIGVTSVVADVGNQSAIVGHNVTKVDCYDLTFRSDLPSQIELRQVSLCCDETAGFVLGSSSRGSGFELSHPLTGEVVIKKGDDTVSFPLRENGSRNMVVNYYHNHKRAENLYGIPMMALILFVFSCLVSNNRLLPGCLAGARAASRRLFPAAAPVLPGTSAPQAEVCAQSSVQGRLIKN